MSKFYSKFVIFTVIIIYCMLALLYGNNQLLSSEGYQLLSNGFSIHYTEDILSFKEDSLATLMISIPMRLYENIYSPLIFIIILNVLSFCILFNTLKHFFKINTLLWFSAIFLLSPWFIFQTKLSYVSYLEFGVAIYFWSIVNLSSIANNEISILKKFTCTITLFVGIAWCAAFHYSWLVLFFTTILLLVRRAIKLNIYGIVIGFISATLITIPNILYLSTNFNLYYSQLIGDEFLGFGITNVYPVLKSIFYWIRFSSTLGQNWLLSETTFNWISSSETLRNNAQFIWLTTVYGIGSFSLLISFCANYLVIRNGAKNLFSFNIINSKTDFLMIFILCVIAAIFIYAAVAPSLLTSLELNISYTFSVLPILLVIDKYNKSDKKYHLIWLILIISYLSCLNFCGAIESNNFKSVNDYSKQSEKITDNFFN